MYSPAPERKIREKEIKSKGKKRIYQGVKFITYSIIKVEIESLHKD